MDNIDEILQLLDREIEYWIDTADEWAEKKKYGQATVNRSMAEGIRHIKMLIEAEYK